MFRGHMLDVPGDTRDADRPIVPPSVLIFCRSFAARHAGELRAAGRFQRLLEEQVIERFLECGDPHHGFARVYCAD